MKNAGKNKSPKNNTIDQELDQIIDQKKSENSALKKIYESLKRGNSKNNPDK